MAYDLRLDDKSDLMFTDTKDLSIFNDEDELIQKLKIRLKTNLKGWLLDDDYGLDYDSLVDNARDQELVTRLITEAILKDNDVDRITNINISFNDRIITISFNAIMQNSEITIEDLEVTI